MNHGFTLQTKNTCQVLMTSLKIISDSVNQPLLLAARWHYFTFQYAWIQADVVRPRDHSLTSQRSTCILQPLTTPKCSLCLSMSLCFFPTFLSVTSLAFSLLSLSFSDLLTLHIASHTLFLFNFLPPFPTSSIAPHILLFFLQKAGSHSGITH